ncbi:hypothetical protein [Polluticaenibacter yanchengensis]|uniref:Internal virion protein B n=1 Tax=Polluticaenibacter yanchengensis TaxID=3014562 RepID=A0ABT4UIQ6_9BACT|nr:hypothetical protein [Chitinophagaceae bacterium LY-5]
MPWFIPAIMAATALISGISNASAKRKAARKQEELANMIEEQDAYKPSQEVLDSYNLARTTLDGRMAGAAQAEANILQSQANTIGAAQRNATDSSQLLGLAAMAQGQTNNSFLNLNAAEEQSYLNRLSNLGQMGMAVAGEKRNAYESEWEKIIAASNARQAAIGSRIGAVNSLFSGLSTGASAMSGMSGSDFKKAF